MGGRGELKRNIVLNADIPFDKFSLKHLLRQGFNNFPVLVGLFDLSSDLG